MSSEKTAVVLVNLGTPDAPTVGAVRRYLKQFLSDPRVVEAPRFVWFWVLRLFILPFRPKRVARLYASIWGDDSPIREVSEQQTRALEVPRERSVDDKTPSWKKSSELLRVGSSLYEDAGPEGRLLHTTGLPC